MPFFKQITGLSAIFLLLLSGRFLDASPLRFGFSGSLSGHFGSYGLMITRGIQAAFSCHPYTLEGKKEHAALICMDDKGDAAITKSNLLTMKKDGIDSFIGIMGTRGVEQMLPLMQKQEVAIYFPWGSNQALQNPKLSTIVNALGLVEPQINQLINFIIDEKKLENIALFHADDSFSTNLMKHCKEHLTSKGKEPILIAHYNRYTLDFGKSLAALCNVDPRAIICISTSMPAVKIINLLFRKGFYGCTFFGIDSTFLVPEILATKGVPFSYSACVPSPTTSTIAIAQQYRKDLAMCYPDESPTILSFAYYIGARLLIDAINRAQDPNKLSVIKALESLREHDFHGFMVNFNPKNRYLFGHQTWLLP
jgi:branched-chain amino acid transport system substrate-binding protein